jgi:hypothetical protein
VHASLWPVRTSWAYILLDLMGVYFVGVCLISVHATGRASHRGVPYGPASHWACTPWIYISLVCTSWACPSSGVHPTAAHTGRDLTACISLGLTGPHWARTSWGVHLTRRVPHGRAPHCASTSWVCTSWACTSWACTSPSLRFLGVHLMGVVCLEAFRFFNLGFWEKSLQPHRG